MSNYTKQINWSGKDALPDSDPNKVISGDLFDTEFTAVQTAVNSKADLEGSATQAFNALTATVGTSTNQVATTEFVNTAVDNVTAGYINNLVYPVGAIFTTVTAYANSAAVAAVMGVGTWAVFASGRTLVGVDSGQSEFDTVEETGGAKTHQLTEAEMPSHTHSYTKAPVVTKDVDMFQYMVSMANPNVTDNTGSAGGDQAHNNLQPYITVYFWKRTA